jgi:hypothetical protein
VSAIGFLHTAESHVETFGALVSGLDSARVHVHAVRPDLLERARVHGLDDETLGDGIRGALRDLVDRDARVIVCTCSTLGGVSEQCASEAGVHVLRVDRPMAELAVRSGSRIGVVATLESTLSPTRALLYDAALAAGSEVTLIDAVCFDAWARFEEGDMLASCSPGSRSDGRVMMRGVLARAALPVCLALIAMFTAVAPSALAGQVDAGATRAYVKANYRFVQAAVSATHPIEVALGGVLSGVRRECPLAAAGSPQDLESTQLSDEVIGDMVLTSGRLILPAARRFVSATARLSWSNRALTATVHAYVRNIAALTRLAPPRLCSDVRSWAASSFRTLPPSTVAFVPRFMSAWVAPGELPPALARFETPADRQLAHTTNGLEERFSELEAREVETWGHIMDTLALLP